VVDIAAWLSRLGLEQYEPAFRANRVEADELPSLTAEDLKDRGVILVGDRNAVSRSCTGISRRWSLMTKTGWLTNWLIYCSIGSHSALNWVGNPQL
jgi:hypothetical protein